LLTICILRIIILVSIIMYFFGVYIKQNEVIQVFGFEK